MKSKRILTLISILGILILIVSLAFANISISIKIDGKEITSDVEPQLIQNRTLVPIRIITESIGADVEWLQETMTVDIVSPYKKFISSYADKGMYIKQAEVILPLFKEDKAVILDVRSTQLRGVSYIKDSMFIPIPQLLDKLDFLPKDKIIAVYCAKNINASYVVTILNMLGYDAYVLENGMDAWKAAGGEITICST
jgi:rhodanese-related sulfurtransferase